MEELSSDVLPTGLSVYTGLLDELLAGLLELDELEETGVLSEFVELSSEEELVLSVGTLLFSSELLELSELLSSELELC